jgi:signal transduction histidine kinase
MAKVFVIDDDPLVTESLGRALHLETPYDVEVFQSGPAALRAVAESPPDLVISDFKMPSMDGLDVLRAIREAAPDAILILLTGYSDKDSAIRAINEVGIYQYIEKPWDLHDLLFKIKAGLERKELLRLLKQTSDRLVATERIAGVGRVASGIAHELANQLALVGYAEAIKVRAAGNPEIVELCDVLIAALRRLAAMVDEIKDFARGSSDAIPLEPADVASVVEEALAILKYDPDVSARRVVADVRARPLARLHRGKFGQVLLNLLRNAVQATPPRGRISVELDRVDGEARLVVEDEGTGMAPDILARLGEPFFTTRPDGTGLGIGIARRIIEDHGGSLTFESQPGKGTRVTVVIPGIS